MDTRDETFQKLVDGFRRHVGKNLYMVSVLDGRNEKAIRLEFQSKDDIADIQTVYLNFRFNEDGLDVGWIWDAKE